MRRWGISADRCGPLRLAVAALLAAGLAAPAGAQFEMRAPAAAVPQSLAAPQTSRSIGPVSPALGFGSPGGSIVAPGFGSGVLGPPLSLAPPRDAPSMFPAPHVGP